MKPPILSLEELAKDWLKDVLEAQRDADAAYYEQQIREIFEEIDKRKDGIGTHYLSASFCEYIECSWYRELKSKYGGKK